MGEFSKKELLFQADEVIRDTIKNFQAVWASDATRFLGLFATSYAFELLKTELSPSFKIDGILKMDFSITHFLNRTNRDAVDLLYMVISDVCDEYAKRELYEILKNVEAVNAVVRDIIQGIYPDIDPVYFSISDPRQMRIISNKRIKTYIKTWAPGIK